MESLNKNWLAILLIAVIFGVLGFLVGRTTHSHHHDHRGTHKKDKDIIIKKDIADSLEVSVVVDVKDGIETTTQTDTIQQDGKTIIIKEVKKVKKQASN